MNGITKPPPAALAALDGITRTSWRTRGVVLMGVPLVFVGAVETQREEPPTAAPTFSVSAPSRVASLPMHVNARVLYWTDRFRGTQWPYFRSALERKGAYEALILGELRRRGMPEELIYLAMMEGGFSPWAVSPAAAVGIWQIMDPTARALGLRVDEWVDERRDPVRATDAALDFLTWLHDRYDSWYLAAAAYNAGPGRLDRILARHAGGRTGDDHLYWEILEHLPLETRHYVPRIVAATLVDRAVGHVGFRIAAHDPYRYDLVFVPGGTPLSRVATSIGVDEQTLRWMNPHLIRGVTPPDEAGVVRVPPGTPSMVVASMAGGSRVRRAD
jgi:membrane-bound lytic murein transglycosylase D